jgi:outer membrane autotransporter protein
VNSDLGSKWMQLDAGVAAQVSSNVSLFLNAGYNHTIGADGDGWNASGGVRVHW